MRALHGKSVKQHDASLLREIGKNNRMRHFMGNRSNHRMRAFHRMRDFHVRSAEPQETDVSEQLSKVIRKADPVVGAGPRGLRPHHLQVMEDGHFASPEAQRALTNMNAIANLFITDGLPRWLARHMVGGMLTAQAKEELATQDITRIDSRPTVAPDLYPFP